MKTQTVCIIDDDMSFRLTTVKILETAGLAKESIAFADGRPAIKFLIKNAGNFSGLPILFFLI